MPSDRVYGYRVIGEGLDDWLKQKVATATNTSATLNASTFTKLLDINTSRIYVAITNPTTYDIIINLRTVANAVDDTGIWIPAGSGWEMKDFIYTGVICAIAVTGAPKVLICEY